MLLIRCFRSNKSINTALHTPCRRTYIHNCVHKNVDKTESLLDVLENIRTPEENSATFVVPHVL